jgi:hypothetical protein
MQKETNDDVATLTVDESIKRSIAHYETANISIMHSVGRDKFVMLVSQRMVDEAIRLRAESKTDRQIAIIMSLTPATVRNLITEGIRTRVLQSPDEIRQIELDKFDSMERKVLEIVWANEDTEGGSTRLLAAVDRLIKISESRRKLLGLDAPQVVDHMPLVVKINGVNIEDL